MAKKLDEIKEEECPYELPEGWKMERLGSISEIISKGTTPKGGKSAYVENGIKFLRVENINDNGRINKKDIKYIKNDVHLNELKRSILHEGDVLITIAGTLGKVAIVSKEDLPINTNQAIAFVRLMNDIVDGNFLLYYIKCNETQKGLLSKSKITAIPNLTLEIIRNLNIVLPPKETQQKIVDIIESLFAKLDIAQEKVEQVLAESENRRSAILHNAFIGKLTKKWREENSVSFDTWKNVKISDIFSLKAGKIMLAKNISDTRDDINKYECYGGNGIRGYVERFNKEGEHPIIGRQGALCGNIHLATGKFYATEHAVVVDYLYDTDTTWAVENLRFLNLNQYSASVAQPGLAVKKIMEVPITFPTYEEQREIGNLLCKFLSVEDKVKSTCQSTLEAIATMRKSILAKAFRGELCS